MDHKKLTQFIVIALIAGIIVGWALKLMVGVNGFPIESIQAVLQLIGRIFITLLKMLVVPLVFVSLVLGTTQLPGPKAFGKLGGSTLLLYLLTTAIAITLALAIATLLHVGQGVDLRATTQLNIPAPTSLSSVILNLFPANPVKALSEGNMLQIIVFAILLGLAISLAGQAGKQCQRGFEVLNQVMMQLVNLVMVIAPIGVFALMAQVAFTLKPSQMSLLLGYFFTVILVLLVHAILTNSMLLVVLARQKPWKVFKALIPAQLFAFSTSSSNATIPVTLQVVEQDLKVPNKIAAFSIPFGATINMDGTAIMQGVATVFIANAYDIHLTLAQLLTVLLTATLSSIGTAGVPSVGLVMLTLVLQQVGLPVEGIALIIGVDRLLDMLRTAVNITGDAVVSVIIAKWFGGVPVQPDS